MTKKSLKVQAYNNIKEKILNCEFSPGMHLNEAVLCETFHVSRTPIRDALSRLEQEGLVTIRSKKGIVVSSLSISEVNNIFELRLLLEPYSIRNYGYTLDEGTLLDYYQNLLRLDITQDAKTFLSWMIISTAFLTVRYPIITFRSISGLSITRISVFVSLPASAPNSVWRIPGMNILPLSRPVSKRNGRRQQMLCMSIFCSQRMPPLNCF